MSSLGLVSGTDGLRTGPRLLYSFPSTPDAVANRLVSRFTTVARANTGGAARLLLIGRAKVEWTCRSSGGSNAVDRRLRKILDIILSMSYQPGSSPPKTKRKEITLRAHPKRRRFQGT